MKKETILKMAKWLFILYCFVLFCILFLDRIRMFHRFEINLFSEGHLAMLNVIPFKTLWEFFERTSADNINADIVIRNIGANLLMFIPMGMALPVLFEKTFNKLWKIIVFAACLVLLIEIVQFITYLGSADIDDVILNVLSCMIGYGIVHIKWVRRMLKLDD